MKNRSIRDGLKVLLAIVLLGGAAVSAGPVAAQGWFTWNKQEKAESPVYVSPGSKSRNGGIKPERTWAEYFFGVKSEPGQKVIYRRSQPVPQKNDFRISEPASAQEMMERGHRNSAVHMPNLMKQQFEDRKRVAAADTAHRMRLTELKALSRRRAEAAAREESIGAMSQPSEPVNVIYNKPVITKPTKVFTDYR